MRIDAPESHSHLRTLTRAGMGVCQGRVCSSLVIQLMADVSGKPLEELVPFPAGRPVRVVPVQAFRAHNLDADVAMTDPSR